MFADGFDADEIFEFVLDGKVEERVNAITDDTDREAISNFLKFEPTERWSASDALESTTFQSDPHATTTLI